MLSALVSLIDRRPWRVLAVALAITAVAAVLGIQVRDALKPRGFDVPGSGSVRARELVAEASGSDPANSVLALIRLPAPYGTPSAQRAIGEVETKLRSDPAIVGVVDAASAQNPAMVATDRRSTYVIAGLRPLEDKQQEDAGKRLLASFEGDDHVTLGGNPVANHEFSTARATKRGCGPLANEPLTRGHPRPSTGGRFAAPAYSRSPRAASQGRQGSSQTTRNYASSGATSTSRRISPSGP
jgi:hypothetical protein